MTVTDFLKQQGYSVVDDDFRGLINKWKQWYAGEVSSFHLYSIYNGDKQVRQKRARLNMAKQGAEYWANLLWNNECFITIDTAEVDADGDRVVPNEETLLNQVLAANSFTANTNQLTELSFALGTGAFIIYPDAEKPRIDYVDVDMIYPLSWYNGDCEDCAFAGVKTNPDKTKTLTLMIHTKQDNGVYRIQNFYFNYNADTKTITVADTPTNVQAEYTSKTKRFALIYPNLSKNAYRSVPLGMSVYANAIDVLKSIDLAFDGINASMQLGRPRIAVSSAALKPTPSGPAPVFDTNDTAFYQLPEAGMKDEPMIKDITTEYRAGSFELSLQNALTLYSRAIGLGEKAFKWDVATRQTATQVVADNNDMQRAMEKHQEVMRTAITTVARAVLDILGLNSNLNIRVSFDDSAVRDRDSERQRYWQYVVAGRFPFWKYLSEYEGYSIADAKALEAEAGQHAAEVL